MSDFLANLMAGDRSAILSAAAIYAVITGLWSVIFCIRVRQWPSTTGNLNSAGLDRFGWSATVSDQDYQADVKYTYDVDGQTYQGHRLSPTIIIVSHNFRALLRWQLKGIERIGDEQVRVFYKPTNPAKSYLIVPSVRTIGIVATTMFGVALLLYAAI